MNHSNHTTLQAYEKKAHTFVVSKQKHVAGDLKEFIDKAFVGIPFDAAIIEIGTAAGRDADYIDSLGYSVERTDAAKSFVDRLNKRGFKARMFNILNDNFDAQYDVVFASAVFLHFTRDEMQNVLRKVYRALNPGGRVSFTVKQGEGECWSDAKLGLPRYFCFWQEQQLKDVLVSCGYEDVSITVGSSMRKNDSGWLQVIAIKAT